jgi:hypothetical protein
VAEKFGVEGSELEAVNRPIHYYEYDNLNRETADEQYDGDQYTITFDTTGSPIRPPQGRRRARGETAYDAQGRVYAEHFYTVDQTTGTLGSKLTTSYWYDHLGYPIKTLAPGGLVSKTRFDGAGRPKTEYLSDSSDDSTWAHARDVAGDYVLEQTEYGYDNDGNVIFVTDKARFHDETATGALVDKTNSPKARVSYAAFYYDKSNRLTDEVDVGTNGGTQYVRPENPPAASDTELRTRYFYNLAGWVSEVHDRRGIIDKTSYDMLGRVTETIENYNDGQPSPDSDRKTQFAYNGSDNVTMLIAVLPGVNQYQKTEYVYGVGSAYGSNVESNEILRLIKYPDKSSGDPSTAAADQESFKYNALGDVKELTDRNATTRQIVYDTLGRVTTDKVTALGLGVHDAVLRLDTAYDSGGRPFRFTSCRLATNCTGGDLVNQVEAAFNGLEQLATEFRRPGY